MNTWYDYRSVWSAHPWVLLIAIAAVVCLVLGIIETFARGPLALLFIPGLALVYIHHLVVAKKDS